MVKPARNTTGIARAIMKPTKTTVVEPHGSRIKIPNTGGAMNRVVRTKTRTLTNSTIPADFVLLVRGDRIVFSE